MKSLLIVAFLTLAACAAQPSKISQTESGWPEVTVSTSDPKAVTNWIINRMTGVGYTLEQQSDNRLFFGKVDDSGSAGAITNQLLIGNAYSTPPKWEVTYLLLHSDGEVKVTANIAVSTQMAFGQVNRMWSRDNQTFNNFQNQLNTMKAATEQAAAPSENLLAN